MNLNEKEKKNSLVRYRYPEGKHPEQYLLL